MSDALLEMEGISKAFPGVLALQDVNLSVRAGEVHALLGENGAGKSTLLKILAGAYSKDSGTIRVAGAEVRIANPRQALSLGISIIYQEFSLLPHLSIAENIFLGRLGRWSRRGLVDWKSCRQESKKLLESLGLSLDPQTPVWQLRVAQQQMVEIAKALSHNARIIAMDEPTAALTRREIDELFRIIGLLKEHGVGIIYVTHRLAEVKEVCGRATVLRDGRNVACVNVAETSVDALINLMVGRKLVEMFPKESAQPGPVSLEVRNLSSRGKFRNVDFSARRGEVLALAGLVGAGRTELARALFGADPVDSGEVLVDGRKLALAGPQDAISEGIGLVPEDRKGQGLVLLMTVNDNVTLASLRQVSRRGVINLFRQRTMSEDFVRRLDIATPTVNRAALFLSGGNQQKVVIAKWLCSRARILILDEPTRGIDVGAKVEVYHLINALVRNGATVIMVSSELPEVLGMSDRILVMHNGRVMGELSREEATEERIMTFASGRALRYVSSGFKGRKAVLGYVGCPRNVSYTEAIVTGLEAAVRPFGGEVRTSPLTESASFADSAESLLAAGVQALVVESPSPVDAAWLVSRAAAVGMPVVAVHSTPVAGVGAVVCSDSRLGTDLIVSYLREQVPDGGKVLVWSSPASSDLVRWRSQNALELLSRSDEFEVILSARDPRQDVGDPDLRAVVALGDSEIQWALSAVESAGRAGDVQVFGFGGSARSLRSVAEGRLAGTIAEFPEEMGRVAAECVFRLLDGEAPGRDVNTTTLLVTPSSVEGLRQHPGRG